MRIRKSVSEKEIDTLESFLPTVFGIKRRLNDKKRGLVYTHKAYTSPVYNVVKKWYFSIWKRKLD